MNLEVELALDVPLVRGSSVSKIKGAKPLRNTANYLDSSHNRFVDDDVDASEWTAES